MQRPDGIVWVGCWRRDCGRSRAGRRWSDGNRPSRADKRSCAKGCRCSAARLCRTRGGHLDSATRYQHGLYGSRAVDSLRKLGRGGGLGDTWRRPPSGRALRTHERPEESDDDHGLQLRAHGERTNRRHRRGHAAQRDRARPHPLPRALERHRKDRRGVARARRGPAVSQRDARRSERSVGERPGCPQTSATASRFGSRP